MHHRVTLRREHSFRKFSSPGGRLCMPCSRAASAFVWHTCNSYYAYVIFFFSLFCGKYLANIFPFYRYFPFFVYRVHCW